MLLGQPAPWTVPWRTLFKRSKGTAGADLDPWGGRSDRRSGRERPHDIPLAIGVVAGSNHRAGLDVGKAHGQRFVLQRRKFFGRHVTSHLEVVATWAQVLPQGKDVDANGARLLHHLPDLVEGLSETEHEAGFGDGAALLGVAEHGVAARVTRLHAHLP